MKQLEGNMGEMLPDISLNKKFFDKSSKVKIDK
jgi:hypothetical protein